MLTIYVYSNDNLAFQKAWRMHRKRWTIFRVNKATEGWYTICNRPVMEGVEMTSWSMNCPKWVRNVVKVELTGLDPDRMRLLTMRALGRGSPLLSFVLGRSIAGNDSQWVKRFVLNKLFLIFFLITINKNFSPNILNFFSKKLVSQREEFIDLIYKIADKGNNSEEKHILQELSFGVSIVNVLFLMNS